MECSSNGVASRGAGLSRVGSIVLLAAVLMLLAAASSAHAAFGIDTFTNQVQNAAAAEETQAGGHPFAMTTTFSFNGIPHPDFGQPVPDGNVRDVDVDLPAGFLGDPTAVPTCTTLQLASAPVQCPVNSQVGIVVVNFANGTIPLEFQVNAYPVFNLAPSRGQVARFGFNPLVGVPVNIVASVRSSTDYGVRATLRNVPQAAPFIATRLTLWGVPASPAHDFQRGPDFVCFADPDIDPGSCSGGGAAAGVEPKAFLANPTLCGNPMTTNIAMTSWKEGDDTASYTTASGMTRCDKLHFEPTIKVEPDLKQADAPTGLSVDLSVPQNDNPNGTATPSLRNAVVSLPVGFSLNAPEADGLKGCTDAQIGLHSTDPVACPEQSKIGDIAIDTPLLDEQLTGDIYLGQPVPGKTFRIFLAAESAARGVSVRLEGVLALDSVTGLVTATFEDNPQLPFSNLHLHFKGGSRAPLATPQTCGIHTATAKLTPWADPNAAPVVVMSTFEVSFDGHGAPCPPRGFSPGFAAGLTNAVGGADSTFTMTLTRNDYEQELRSVALTMPKGLLARIADVPVLCSDAQATAGTCGEGSQIGSVTTGAGAGSTPFFLPGRVYVTGPYKGGPYGLSIVVPAVAGPFDLGTVVVRASILLDKHTSQLSVVSDPLPTIVEGIPLRLRVVNVRIDRPHFIFAPSNCSPSSVDAQIGSTTGTVARVNSRFQVANCARLPFKPSIKFTVGGKGHTKAGQSTPLTAVVKMPPGQANLKGVNVVLPLALNARLDVVEKACTRVEFEVGKCEKARVGSAVAVTPLLRDPLRGSAYFVKDPNKKKGSLPDLVVALRGQVDFDLVGKVKIPASNQLSTNFDTVPDVPISKFELRLVAGSHGPVGVAENLCTRKSRRAPIRMTLSAQNGKVVHRDRPLQIAGCRTKAGKK